jgi:hypothetical protein
MVANGVIVPPYDSSKGEILKAENLKSLKSDFESKGKRVQILDVKDEWPNIKGGSLIFLHLWTDYAESHSTRTDNMIPPEKIPWISTFSSVRVNNLPSYFFFGAASIDCHASRSLAGI